MRSEPNPTVLVVEEGKSMREALAFALRNARYRVIEAFDGAEAWARIVEDRPDAVLMEALLPHKTGFEVCSELKSNPDTRSIPVILMSSVTRGTGRPDDYWRKKTNADDFLTRPFDLGVLLERLDRLLLARRRATVQK
jgi:DNA-binding response OmpR family regulator